MIKITGVSYDPIQNVDSSDLWIGWLPIEGFEVLQKL
jgi:hypothetical protein